MSFYIPSKDQTSCQDYKLMRICKKLHDNARGHGAISLIEVKKLVVGRKR